MKKTLFLFALGIISLNARSQTTHPAGVTGCIARYDFTNSGTPITSLPDVSLNGNNGTTANISAAQGFRNTPNKAMQFNGSTSIATVPHASILHPSNMTIIALVKLDTFYSGLCQTSQIILKGYPYFSSGVYGMSIGDNQYDGNCNTYTPSKMQMGALYGAVAPSANTGNYISTNTWYFFASTYDGSTVKHYQVPMNVNNHINNVQPFFSQAQSGTIGSNTLALTIGGTANLPTYPYSFSGAMDEVALFNKALTTSEIQSVYDYLWGLVGVTGISSSNLCVDGTVAVGYTVGNTAYFASNNTFTVQLSDSAGSFSSPVNIGSITSSNSDTITCIIPSNTISSNKYRVRLVASNIPYTTADNGSDITINNNSPAIVSITATPGTSVNYGDTVKFTANITNGGPNPSIQWKKNGTSIPGASNNTWNTNNLNSNDTVSVVVTKSNACGNFTTTAKIGVNINTSIDNSLRENVIALYPNPNGGSFTLRANVSHEAFIEIVNTIGQSVYSDIVVPQNGIISKNIRLNLATGIYTLKLKAGDAVKNMRFTIER